MNVQFVKSAIMGVSLASLLALSAHADALKPLNSDTEPDRMDWSQLEAKFGAAAQAESGLKVGAVAKTLTNEYWRSLGEGYVTEGKAVGVPVDLQAGTERSDQFGQLSIAENMLTSGYSVLLVSPQTDANLQPGDRRSREGRHIPVVNVNDAVIPSARSTMSATCSATTACVRRKWFIDNRPNGGKVAVVEGMAGVYAAVQRTAGFKSTITAGWHKFPWWPACRATGTVSFPTTSPRTSFSSIPI